MRRLNNQKQFTVEITKLKIDAVSRQATINDN